MCEDTGFSPVTGEGRGLAPLRCESPFQPGQAAQVESSNSREQTGGAVTVETVTAPHLHTLCFLMAMESHPQVTVRSMPIWVLYPLLEQLNHYLLVKDTVCAWGR